MLMIQLTRVNEADCWVNAYSIAAIERHRDGSLLHFVGSSSLTVKESPEAILQRLPEPAA